MTKPIAIQMEKETHRKLKILAVDNSIPLGKMLEILIEKYNESQKDDTNMAG